MEKKSLCMRKRGILFIDRVLIYFMNENSHSFIIQYDMILNFTLVLYFKIFDMENELEKKTLEICKESLLKSFF